VLTVGIMMAGKMSAGDRKKVDNGNSFSNIDYGSLMKTTHMRG
jgi:hypothetical protein